MSLLDVTIGEDSPDFFNVVIEIPKGSRDKYEFDDKTGVFKLDRVLPPSLFYPVAYGFIPQTLSQDGDRLDAVILSDNSLLSGRVIRVRPIGLLKMTDSGKEDFKILGVQADDPDYKNVKDVEDIKIKDLPAQAGGKILEEITHFFQVYKGPEEKEVIIVGWEGAEGAKREIGRAQELFNKSG
ncbi:MAG: inorganic diphosphatase [Candidatus Yanofskybacteria bacterium]|nr:inorganic diphosphatase [Candidatus Yanofskybacteria bacterium]